MIYEIRTLDDQKLKIQIQNMVFDIAKQINISSG
jgi:hypothetical protein